MPEIPEDVKRQALDAVESIRGSVHMSEPGGGSATRENGHSLMEHSANIVDAYDSQGMATAREQQRARGIEHNVQQEQQHGRDL